MGIHISINHEYINGELYFSMNNIHKFLVGTRPSGEMKNNKFVTKVSGTILNSKRRGYAYGVAYKDIDAFISTIKRADQNKITLLIAAIDYLHATTEKPDILGSNLLKYRIKELEHKEQVLEEENRYFKNVIEEIKTKLERI